MHLKSILIGTFAVCAIAAPSPASRHVVHEKRDHTLRTWEKRDRVDPEQLLPVRIGLTQSNLHKGPRLLHEV